ncbi:hypothetical protein ACQCVH_06695 [Bacillus infantis]|uniref:hypothetical protein n=1 Tax=Bacillus infantis TaxID=324767 RepID=UPI003CF22C46
MLKEENEWVVRFLNLPDEEQIDFLYRYCLDEAIKEKLERKVFESEKKQPKERGR